MSDVLTTLTTTTDLVNSEWIDPLLLAYAMPRQVITDKCRMYRLADRATKTASAAKFVKDSASAMTEATDVDSIALDTAQTGITAAELGIVRIVTKVAKRTNILGEAGLMAYIFREGGELCAEKFESDILALFPSASTGISASGSPFTLAHYVALQGKLRTNNARGTAIGIWSDNQAANLRNACASSQAALLGADRADESIVNGNMDQYVGTLFGNQNWETTLCTTANGDVDDVGAMLINGASNPENAPIGLCEVWGPEVERSGNATPSLRAEEVAITMMVGQAEISDFNYVKATTGATA